MRKTQKAHWYLAQLKPGGLERAKISLARQEFESFMSAQEVSQRRSGRLSSAMRPLFPGYLFVRIPPSRQDWRAINNTYSISRIVALQNGHPTEFPSDLMLALRARTDFKGRLQAPDDLVAGKRVRIEPLGESASQQATQFNGETRKVRKGDDGAVPIDLP